MSSEKKRKFVLTQKPASRKDNPLQVLEEMDGLGLTLLATLSKQATQYALKPQLTDREIASFRMLVSAYSELRKDRREEDKNTRDIAALSDDELRAAVKALEEK